MASVMTTAAPERENQWHPWGENPEYMDEQITASDFENAEHPHACKMCGRPARLIKPQYASKITHMPPHCRIVDYITVCSTMCAQAFRHREFRK